MDYIFDIYSINFVHKSLHYWTRDCFKNNRRSLLMRTKSTIKLFATAILATATIGVHAVHADAQIIKDKDRDLIEIISDPYATYEEADKALNNVKDKYLAEYGDYRGGVNPTEDLKHYEAYAILDTVSLSKQSADEVAEKIAKAFTTAKHVEEVKPVTPAKPVDEGKTSNDIKEIKGKFTEIKTTSTGLTFKAKLPELAPHDGPILPNIQATLTEKATGKEVAKTGVVLEGLSEELKESDALLYANILEGTIFEPSLTPGNYILTVEGTTGPTYGQNTDKRKRHFVFSTKVTLTGEGNATTTTQPEKPKDSTTKPKSDQTTNNVNNNQQPNNDKNKQITNNNTGKQDKNELSTNKTSDTKTGKQTSDNTLSQEKQQTTSTSTTKPENNKNNDKKTLPNTGESTSILGIIGTILSITGLGFIVKRKRG